MVKSGVCRGFQFLARRRRVVTAGRFFVCAALVAVVSSPSARAAVRINEVHYHPPSPHGKTHEFIELLNDGESAVSLGGWRLSGVSNSASFHPSPWLLARSSLSRAIEPR